VVPARDVRKYRDWRFGSFLSDASLADQVPTAEHRDAPEVALIARSFAEQGDAKAEFALGGMYLRGEGVTRDYGQSLAWFLRAAEQGDRDAMFVVAAMYAKGIGLKPDNDQALEWYRKAAEKGHRGAQATLGLRYLLGDGVARDETVAARWTYRAASQGIPEAQLLLAKMLSEGRGTTKNNVAAYSWATIATSRLGDKKLRDSASQFRQQIGSALTPDQIAQAEKTAKDWGPALEPSGATANGVTQEQDGIVASLSVGQGDAVVSWHFVRPQAVPISEVSGTIDGQALGVPRLEPYPTQGAKTWILLLLDVADPNRGPEIQRDKDTLATLVSHAQPHDEIDVATYGDRLRLLLPAGSGDQPLADMLRAAVPQTVPANLGQALKEAIALPSPTPVARRGIFVLTDGHSDDALNVSGLIEAANSNHTALNFLVSPSTRLGDLPALEALATATGGTVVKDDELPAFLQSPFGLLDSGAVAHFPVDSVVRNSQTDPKISVVFGYGGRTFELSTHLSNEARIARQGLEQTLNSCEALCSENFKSQIRSRIALISAEEKTYDAAGDDPTKLRAYAKECRVCSFREEANARAESLESYATSVNPTPEHAATNPETVPFSKPALAIAPKLKSAHPPSKRSIEQAAPGPPDASKLDRPTHSKCVTIPGGTFCG
jgi:hypothetical protein